MSYEDPTGLDDCSTGLCTNYGSAAGGPAGKNLGGGVIYNSGSNKLYVPEGTSPSAAKQIAGAIQAGGSLGSLAGAHEVGGMLAGNGLSAMYNVSSAEAAGHFGKGAYNVGQGVPAEESRLTPETVPEAEAADRAQEQLDADYAIATGKAKLPTGPTYLSAPGSGTLGEDVDPSPGYVYRVPSNKTSSGLPYVGRTDDPATRQGESRDGRDRSGASILRTYPAGNTAAGRAAEQQEIINHGGVPALDNRRNEINFQDWDRNGLSYPP